MVICVCKGISEHRIREAADRGARDVSDLTRELGVATGCGGCAPAAGECLRRCREERETPVREACPQPA
jgi:bacterioferritin-associated ferredoxin